MRAIVEVRMGGVRKKAAIEPGGVLRVGRTELSDLVVPHDEGLAGAHFELSWDGQACALRSLKETAYAGLREKLEGAGLTLLNGEPSAGGAVRHGDWIKAGSTVFMVYFEGATRPRREPPGQGPPTEVREAALAALRAEPWPLFAVLDAAADPRILELLRESVEEHRSLYDGVKGDALAQVAPYLVGLTGGSRLLERLALEGWGKRWGIYLTCPRPPDEVRRHLRRLLMVADDESEQVLYFRFYDPRVLGSFLASGTPRQREQLFGEIGCFLLEGPRGALERHAA